MDVISYYSDYLRPGMVDLSQSSAAPPQLDPDFRGIPWESVRPPGGVAELRSAVAATCFQTLCRDDVLLCSGASEALVAVALGLELHGRPVVALPGTYPSFTATLRSVGAHRYRSFEECPHPA